MFLFPTLTFTFKTTWQARSEFRILTLLGMFTLECESLDSLTNPYPGCSPPPLRGQNQRRRGGRGEASVGPGNGLEAIWAAVLESSAFLCFWIYCLVWFNGEEEDRTSLLGPEASLHPLGEAGLEVGQGRWPCCPGPRAVLIVLINCVIDFLIFIHPCDSGINPAESCFF